MRRAFRPAVISAVLVALSGYFVSVTMQASAAPVLLSQGKPATASSVESAAFPASAAFDGAAGTRWSSAFSDPQWIQVDLGATATLNQIVLTWEAAFARSFQLQTSPSATGPWTNVYTTTTGAGGTQTLSVTGSGRFVRMNGTVRGTPYGYSLFEFQVFGEIGGNPAGGCGTANAALNKPATASSVESATFPASAAFDASSGTRWSSLFSDPQWIQVDLGSSMPVCQVVLTWEAAFARSFQIQVSSSATGPWTNIYTTTTGTGGTQTLSVSGTGRFVRMNGTVRGTPYGYSLFDFTVRSGTSPTGSPTSSPTSSPTPSPTPPGDFWGVTSNIPPAQNVLMVKILNRTNGRYPDSQVFWSYNGVAHSIAEQPYFDMPANTAGRMYFYLGTPNSQYFDFIEFTVGPDVFNGNTTRVDAFGLKLAMRLHAHDGYDVEVGEDRETFAEDRAVTFQKFVNEVPAQFDVLSQNYAPFRIVAPGSDPSFRAGGVNAGYFTAYAQSVGVSAPTSDIFGCAGTLSENPQMCAGLNRHVAHLPVPQQADPSLYYQTAPANYYSKFWHDHSIDKRSYGFPYDDYVDQSSFVSHGDPQWLLVAVGW